MSTLQGRDFAAIPRRRTDDRPSIRCLSLAVWTDATRFQVHRLFLPLARVDLHRLRKPSSPRLADTSWILSRPALQHLHSVGWTLRVRLFHQHQLALALAGRCVAGCNHWRRFCVGRWRALLPDAWHL